jgi:3-oxoacyl-[acyl-carrier protein] reductase
MDLKLNGKVCLVTGAGIGLGRAVALGLAAEGATLILAGRRRALLEGVRDEIAGSVPAHVVPVDLASPDGPAWLAEAALAAFGHVDVLVNNAGVSRPLSGEAADGAWDEAFALNFTAARRLTQGLLPRMRERKFGRIINVTGALASRQPNAAAPAKAALLSWARGLAGEIAPDGVTVNCLAPGRFDTEQIRDRLHPTAESRDAFIAANIPVGRFGAPEEFAAIAVFLTSPLAGSVSAAHIPVDGAMHRLAL